MAEDYQLDEEFAQAPLSKDVVRRLARYLAPYKAGFIAGLLMEVVWVGSMVLGPHLIKVGIDKYIAAASISGVFMIAALYAVNSIFRYSLVMVEIRVVASCGQNVLNDLRNAVFEHIQRLSMRYFDRTKQGKIIATWQIAADIDKMVDEYAALLLNLLSYKSITASDIEGAALCSVVPPLTPTFEQLCQHHLGVPSLVISAGVKTGMRIRMDNPREVGGDRVANAIAGYQLYGGPVIIIDLGTATTFDVVSEEGDYLGGAIAPGIGIAAEALNKCTSQLPRVELTAPSHVIGKNTITAMQSGIVFGYIGLIEGLVARISREMGTTPHVIATGGLARPLTGITSVIEAIEPDLTLKGLCFIYQMNKP